MTFYAIPSFCAILIKVWLAWRGQAWKRENRALILLLGALLAMNLVEFGLFMLADRPRDIVWLMHLYYCASTFTAATILGLFLQLTGNAAGGLLKFNWAMMIVFGAFSLTPGVVIAGVENIGYTWMRIPGPLYVVWDVYIVSTLLLAVGLLIAGYTRSKDDFQKRRCLAVLLGLAPFLCCAVGVILLMLLGFRINATVLLSSAVIFFLVALIYSEQRYGLFKMLSHVPFTEEHSIRTELAKQIYAIESCAFNSSDAPSFKDQIKKIEALYIDLAVIANDGNKTHAANALGISNATLHRKASRKCKRQVPATRSLIPLPITLRRGEKNA